MTDTPDREHVPGQLDLGGHALTNVTSALRLSVAERRALAVDLEAVHEQKARLTELMGEHRLRAVDRVAAAVAAHSLAGAELDQAVAEARGMGATWDQIARAAGMTRQSAHERWSGK